MFKHLKVLAAWIDYMLAGPPEPARPCEVRPARFTYYSSPRRRDCDRKQAAA